MQIHIDVDLEDGFTDGQLFFIGNVLANTCYTMSRLLASPLFSWMWANK